MAATETSICNLALQILGVPRITSLSQDNKAARACSNCYESLRDLLLEQHVWGFARTQNTPALSATTPAFGYAYAFELPDGFLRWILPADSANDWTRFEDLLYTNEGDVIYLDYIKRITDPNKFPPTFQHALAAKIAEFTCEELTQSRGKLGVAKGRYDEAIALAKKTNAIQRLPQDAADSSWLTVRQG